MASYSYAASFISELLARNCGDKEWLKTFSARHHWRDFIVSDQSLVPATPPANLFEKNLPASTRETSRSSITSPIVDARRCKLRQSTDATQEQPCVLSRLVGSVWINRNGV